VTFLLMVSIGLVMVLSASSVQSYKQYGSSFAYFYRQILGVAVGVMAMIVMAKTDYHRLRGIARPLLAVTIVLLAAVLVPGIGTVRGGASRWLLLGPLSVQPSEIAKLTLIIFAAHVLEGKGRNLLDPVELAVPLLPATSLVALLIIAQPDLGTTIMCAGCVAAVLFLSGARLRHVGLLSMVGLLLVMSLAFGQSYRRDRILSYLNPWADPLNTGYHVIQGQIALGSGGLFGVGLGASRQKWSYVPSVHTDFIYAIIGEELGLAGTLLVLVLFVFLLYLGTRIAKRASDRFGFLLAGGITAWIGIQALTNMAAVSGLLPITGVPLPLISFGSSSLVVTMAAIGVLLSVGRRTRA
jgi:cell division protein FtsW